MKSSVLVIGAGIVGTTVALELQSRGAKVTLVDRQDPGKETSYGNAGVLARSSLIPFNNPSLWRVLPKLMLNRSAGLRYNTPYLLRNMSWALGFLGNARPPKFRKTIAALDGLIGLSTPENRRLLKAAGMAERMSEKGWLYLYRSETMFEQAKFVRQVFDEFSIKTEVLTAGGLGELEPTLNRIFPKALWIKDASSIDNPGAVVGAYAALFARRGGAILKANITRLKPEAGAWVAQSETGTELRADKVVMALGPWSNDLLPQLGIRIPMGYERGYHRHFKGSGRGQKNAGLGRPVCDISAGYVVAPMEQGLRLTSGVELTQRDAPKNLAQIQKVEMSAREALDIGKAVVEDTWVGSRPTLPDSRPVIGEAPSHKGLFLAFGHQHIGFSTGSGTAKIIADQMQGVRPAIDPAPFAPGRFH